MGGWHTSGEGGGGERPKVPVQPLRYLSHRVRQEHRQDLQRRLFARLRDYQQAVLAAALVLQKVGVVGARHVHQRERQRHPGGDVQDHQQAQVGGGRRRSAERAAAARPQAGGRGRDARGEVGRARRLWGADEPRQRAEVLIPLPRRRPRLVIRRVPRTRARSRQTRSDWRPRWLPLVGRCLKIKRVLTTIKHNERGIKHTPSEASSQIMHMTGVTDTGK